MHVYWRVCVMKDNIKMEVLQSFLMTIVVVLSFGVAVVAGQNGLLSARCAARCLTEHKDRLKKESDRNNHRKFMIDHCKHEAKCFECMKPCAVSERDLVQHNCVADYCKDGQLECEKSCEFLHYTNMYKEGVCPRPETAVGFEAVCLTSCKIDSNCMENTKCCPNLCGYVCRTPDYSGQRLPGIPSNLSIEEHQEGRALRLSWFLPPTNWTVPGLVLFVLEQRNTTSQRPIWNVNIKWTTVTVTGSRHIILKEIHAGHWYQFRLASVTSHGTQGYSSASPPFISSRSVQPPLPPQNITEGVTTLRKGQVEVTIHWEPPKYSDIPVSRYKITWYENLTRISPVLVRITVEEKTVAAHTLKFKLKRLKPGTTYNIKIEAVVQHNNRELRSKTAKKKITTYTPPNSKPDKKEQVSSLYADIVKVEQLEVADDIAYFDKGSLKAKLSWAVGKDFQSLVKSFMIYWTPVSCDQDFASLEQHSATSDVSSFEIYDLQFECRYNIRVIAVTKAGIQGKPRTVQLRTPICEKIRVKGNSLPPECPDRVPHIPRSPRKIKPVTIKRNCSIDVNITWKHPRSDLPIDSYLVTYEKTNHFRDHTNTDGTVYKPKPRKIELEKVTSALVSGLEPGEDYVIKVHAVSSAGIGDPAFIEILTPTILPCGSDKDPEPPDKAATTVRTTFRSSTVFVVAEDSSISDRISTSVSRATITKYSTSTHRPPTHSGREEPLTDIYKSFVYIVWFISEMFSNS